MNMTKGSVYILLNPKFPDLIKIGKTRRNPMQRVTELSRQTGVPADYILVYDELVNDCDSVERKLHEKFAGYREARNKEFFRVRPTDAIKSLQELAKNHRVDLTIVQKSRNILSEIKSKYPNYLRKDIVAIHIVHKESLCLLESNRVPFDDLGDEILERIDLAIFWESPFTTDKSPDENADDFIGSLTAYDLIMTTNLFDEESCNEIAAMHEYGQQAN